MLERAIENVLYANRWILAPIYLGLSAGLVLLGIKFFEEVLHALPSVLTFKETDLVLLILSVFYHAQLGLQIIIEDYISSHSRRTVVLLLSNLFCLLFGIVGVVSVLKISLGA